MKNQFVNTLQEGDFVNDYFIATRKDLRSRQTGDPFLGMVFKDRTGDVGGVVWKNAAEMARLFSLGDVVNVKGRVNTYQNRLQIQVEQVLPLRENEYSLDDLILTASNPQTDFAELKAILDTVENPWLQKLLGLFWEDTAFVDAFTSAVAAKKWHHEYRGGLVRHCYEMARMAETMCELYPEIDRDVLLLGVFLHDIGKLQELTHDLVVDYTNEGKLLGHLQIGAEITQAKMGRIPDFPNNLRLELLHCILSHHGELQNGSPVLPKTLEAIVLHHIDNLDAQAAAIARIVRETRDRKLEWSEYLPLIERVIWTKGG